MYFLSLLLPVCNVIITGGHTVWKTESFKIYRYPLIAPDCYTTRIDDDVSIIIITRIIILFLQERRVGRSRQIAYKSHSNLQHVLIIFVSEFTYMFSVYCYL